MKSNLKVITMVAGVIMLTQAAVAQVNLNSTTSAASKASVNTNRVTNAVTKTSQVTGRVVQNTGKIVQGTTNIASKTTTNVQSNINAAANANAKSKSLLIENESAINSNVAAETKGNSEPVKQTVVSEAKEIKAMTKEMRNDVKPGLNLTSETSASTNASVGKDGIAVSGEAKNSTNADANTGVNTDRAKDKVAKTKDKAEQKTKEAASKVKNTKVKAKAETSASSQTSASAGNQ